MRKGGIDGQVRDIQIVNICNSDNINLNSERSRSEGEFTNFKDFLTETIISFILFNSIRKVWYPWKSRAKSKSMDWVDG